MADFALESLTTGERNQVGGLKRQVVSLADKLGVVRETASQIAPRVMKLYNELAAKYEGLGGFVGFARLFDPAMATHAADKDGVKGYRNNKTYAALDYMRRTLRLSNRPRGQQGRRDPATDQLARTLATVLQVVKGADSAVVWSAVGAEFGLSERAISRLKSRVESVKPIIDLSGVRAVGIKSDNVVHMDRTAFARVDEQVPARRGRAARAA